MADIVDGCNLHRRNLSPKDVPIKELTPLAREVRRHSNAQIIKLSTSIDEFGFVLPILMDEQKRVIAGWALVLAAKRSLMTHVPAITVARLSEAQLRTLRIALNRLAEDAAWNLPELKLELEEILILEPSLDLTLSGFEMGEIDFHLQVGSEVEEPPVEVPDRTQPPTTRVGDLWILGPHRLLCGNALEDASYKVFLGDVLVRSVHTDFPYNVKLKGNVTGKGQVVHDEFVMASGEMTQAEFVAFLISAMVLMTAYSLDGALHYLFIDWRHLYELITAAQGIYTEQKNLCVWNKSNGSMGSFYRSKHELIAVYKHGTAPHINNVELGRYGRNRTNVWDYAGVNTFRPGRMEDLQAHPTVKPLRLIADAILDSTHRGDAVLDPFLGSGTTLLACEDTGRVGYGMELDPRYVDVAVRRWQTHTGQSARLKGTHLTFDELSIQRTENREVGDE